MATIQVSCPDCHSTQVIKAGKQPNGTQRYRCQNLTCERTIFQLIHVAHGRLPETQRLCQNSPQQEVSVGATSLDV